MTAVISLKGNLGLLCAGLDAVTNPHGGDFEAGYGRTGRSLGRGLGTNESSNGGSDRY